MYIYHDTKIFFDLFEGQYCMVQYLKITKLSKQHHIQ